MARSSKRLDEDDVRIRPGRTKARRRTKDRPNFSEARLGTVLTVDRGRFTLATEHGDEFAVKARELGRKGVVVGDHVHVVGLEAGSLDNPVRIVLREPRTTELRRTADDQDPIERVIVANADTMGIVVATKDPEPRVGLIDRSVVAALDAGISPWLIVTKADLSSTSPLATLYGPLGIPFFQVTRGEVTQELRAALIGRTTVLVGHSGVGKSTLVNALIPEAQRATGVVNAVTGRGRHTSTSAYAFPYQPIAHGPAGVIIDTPGIRSFGLAHVSVERIIGAFPELAEETRACPRNCSHDEVDCALNSLMGDDRRSARIDSLRRLLRSRNATT